MRFRRSVNNRIVNSENYRKPYLDDEPYQDFMERVPYRAVSEQFETYPESEDQQPYKSDDDYQALEQTYYGPSTNFKFPQPTKRNGIPNVRATCEELERRVKSLSGKAREKAYEEYHNTGCPEYAELFECWAYGCCCLGDVSYLQVECTYPIIDGPYVRQADGSWLYADNQATKEDKKTKAPCVDGDGSCPPEIKVTIYSKTQQMEMRPIWLGKPPGVTCNCPITTTCCKDGDGDDVSIGIASNTMSIGTSQNLYIVNENLSCTYEFRIVSGGGKITKSGTYTAPSSNPNCVNNVTIGLYDVTKCKLCATARIAINNPAVTGVAYNEVTKCSFTPPYAGYYYCCAFYNCKGELVTGSGGSSACNSPSIPGYGCSGKYPANTDSRAWNDGFPPECVSGDVRTTEMKAQGCCPSQLL